MNYLPPFHTSKSLGRIAEEDELIFETPQDLLCPITHDIFKDPVLNVAGHMYEREAILQHFAVRLSDPMTGVPCESSVLTPVHAVKSRCLEYREKVAKACVERACAVACRDPMRYLRRAAEVSGTVPLRVPGLSPEFVAYVASHNSNAYDCMALTAFAEGLQVAGYVDRAAHLYYRLLGYEDDRSQQAATLKKCIDCLRYPGQGGDDGCDGDPSSATPPVDLQAIARLSDFLDARSPPSAPQLIEIMHHAAISPVFTLRLCEHLLRKASRGAAGSPRADEEGRYRELLLTYVQLHHARLGGEVADLRGQVAACCPGPSSVAAGAAAGANAAAAGSRRGAGPGKQGGVGRREGWPPRPLAAALAGLLARAHPLRAAASAVFAAASLARGDGLLLRLGRSVPLLILMHTHSLPLLPPPTDRTALQHAPVDRSPSLPAAHQPPQRRSTDSAACRERGT